LIDLFNIMLDVSSFLADRFEFWMDVALLCLVRKIDEEDANKGNKKESAPGSDNS
jgi:hypothetical protein